MTTTLDLLQLRRPAPPSRCPHCDDPAPSAHHYRDAGSLDPEAAGRLGYCPVLALRRGGRR